MQDSTSKHYVKQLNIDSSFNELDSMNTATEESEATSLLRSPKFIDLLDKCQQLGMSIKPGFLTATKPKSKNCYDKKVPKQSKYAQRFDFTVSEEDSPTKFLKSSLQRCRILPKTSTKISLSKTSMTRCTKPKPFVLSKTNNHKKSSKHLHKNKHFKARKMPDMSIPFMVFKNEKNLTTFKEFGITKPQNEDLSRSRWVSVDKVSSKFRNTMISPDYHFEKVSCFIAKNMGE